MKILISQNGWSGQGISGGDKHLIEAANWWKEKHEVHLLVPKSGRVFLERNFQPEIGGLEMSTTWEILPFGALRSLPIILLAYLQRLLGASLQVLLDPDRRDVVVASSHFFYDLWPLIVLKFRSRSKLVVYVYHLLASQERPRNLRNKISLSVEALSLNLIRRYANLVLTDNRQTRRELIDRGIAASKIGLIGVGIRRPFLQTGLTKEFDLCFLGRLVKQKGIADLVPILERLLRTNPEIRLVVMGSGDEEAKFRSKIEKENLGENIVFLGAVDEATKYSTLAKAKIFVAPSYEEGWGLSLGEALSCGLPAVAYDLPVLREVFNGAPVWVPLADVESMAAEAERLLSELDYYQRKAEASRRVVDGYYLDQVLPKERDLIERL